MQKKVLYIVLFALIFETSVSGQVENFLIKMAPFCSDNYDEFSPVYYKNGLVFCSNRNTDMLFNYSTTENKGFFKINYCDTSATNIQESRLLSKALSSHYNDGPATFSHNGDTVYFSRNLIITGGAKDERNKLGIFYSVMEGGKWGKVQELRFNNDSYNITTPCLSPDGKRLYFASDKGDGYGGSDLYYCKWKDGYWDNPVNLGPVINTRGNEAYPFITQSGDLFFSSDGHSGLGGKDIFFSRFVDSAWITPVRLNAPINSSADDFGFIANDTLSAGYFSSNRGKSVDIYSFKTINPQLLYCVNQKTSQFCFSFTDDTSVDIDPLSLQFQWDFGDGKKETGYVVEHCFAGPGKYTVNQNVIDKKSGSIVFNKMHIELGIKDIDQLFITSDNFVPEGKSIRLDALSSNVPGYKIHSTLWDFGDGERASGDVVQHTFKDKGEFTVKLAANAKEISTGIAKQICVSKVITVSNNTGQLASLKAEDQKKRKELHDVKSYENTSSKVIYSASDALADKAFFQVEILESKEKIPVDNDIFKEIAPKYTIRTVLLPADKAYSYVIDEETSLMACYPAYKDAISMGFDKARIKTHEPFDPGEIELWNFKRLYGITSDIYFTGTDSRINSGALPLLDQLVSILKKYEGMKLIIACHTDNTGVPSDNISLSRKRAQNIVDYLVVKGINRDRLSAEGYGDLRPIASNFVESERKKNRRIDFIDVTE